MSFCRLTITKLSLTRIVMFRKVDQMITNHTGSQLVKQQAVRKTRSPHASNEEMDSWLEEVQDEIGRRKMALDDAVINDSLVNPSEYEAICFKK